MRSTDSSGPLKWKTKCQQWGEENELQKIFFFFSAITLFLSYRKFIDMGFIDKDRIAIWGWVGCLYFNFLCLINQLHSFIYECKSSSSVIWWLCRLNGFGCWHWTLQVWDCCGPSSQVGLLWYVISFFLFSTSFLWSN